VLPLLLAVPCSALLPHAGVACSARRAIYPSSSSLWATSKERKEEIEEKLAALRRAKNQGNTYESLVGKGKSFAEEAEKKLSTLGKGEVGPQRHEVLESDYLTDYTRAGQG
jgi:hypothetical protein